MIYITIVDGVNEFDPGLMAFQGWPILFHETHSATVKLSRDRRRARRIESVKGVCFSNRPICVGERIYVRVTEASTSTARSGALRFGFTADDPCTIDPAELPRSVHLSNLGCET